MGASGGGWLRASRCCCVRVLLAPRRVPFAMTQGRALVSASTVTNLHDRDPDDDVAVLRQAGGEGLTYIPDVPAIGSEWRRPVEELTLSELRTYYGYKKFAQSREPDVEIPTFDEFLTWVRSEPDLQAVYLDFKLLPSQIGICAAASGGGRPAQDETQVTAVLQLTGATWINCPNRPHP